jgi:signal transduction histidine kinase/ligand-binding sensor domain-containing protein/CheY-like chemotaxis protein
VVRGGCKAQTHRPDGRAWRPAGKGRGVGTRPAVFGVGWRFRVELPGRLVQTVSRNRGAEFPPAAELSSSYLMERSLWRAFFVFIGLAGFRLAAEPAIRDLSFATTTFSVDAGLPSNVAQALVQTRDGYIWVGTEAGLARFDGIRFLVFRQREFPEIPDNLIRCLLEDRDGWLWIGTQGGLVRYRDGKFERLPGIDRPIGAIVQDGRGSIWVGAQGAGLWEYHEGKLESRADEKLVTRTSAPMRVLADSSGRVWAALNEGPLMYWKDGSFHSPEAPLAALRQSNRILEGPRGTLWIAAQDGLFRWRDGALRRFGRSQGIGDEQITDLYIDHAGRLWVAARGLWVAENPEVDDFVSVSNAQVEYSRFILQDREGTYWIGSSGDGLARMRPSAFRVALDPDAMPFGRVRSVTADRYGYVWVATGLEPRGLTRLAPSGESAFVPIGSDGDADVSAVCAAGDGTIWIGSRTSLAAWRDGTLRRFPAYRNVRAMFERADGTMCFGVALGGAIFFRDGQFTPAALPDALNRATPTAFAEDRTGALYIGFLSQGIVRLDRGTTTVLDETSKLPSLEIRALHLDTQGRLWVGLRRHGLTVLLDGGWKNPNDFVQPFAERVSAIDEDDQGNLWLGTVRGVIWGRKDDFLAVARGASAEGRFHLAGLAQGVKPGVIGFGTQPTWAKAPDGTLWFAGREGLVAVRPDFIPQNPVPPLVQIESVVADGREQRAGGVVSLPPGVRTLAIDYTALSFAQPSRVMFRYRLVGYDHDWVQAAGRRTAFYTSLRPGQYEFRVVACNEDGVWNETGARLALVQLPWFYQTWWFYIAMAFIIAAVVFLMYLWRTTGLRRLVVRQTEQIRHQMEKEAHLHAELERTARLESLGVLAGGIAHDFNNLLTVIIANVGLARMDQRVESAAGDVLSAAERGAKRAADLTQQLLTFAKGGDPVRRAVALPDVVREAADFARHGTQVRCDFEVPPGLPPANVDPAQISRVIHNLVLNATQAMPGGGVVQVRLGDVTLAAGEVATLRAGRYVKLTVTDTGCGIAPEHLSRIFEPYFTTKGKSSGLGLATVHSIVKKHDGHVAVTSTLGAGATFEVWLPAATEPALATKPEQPKPAAGEPARVLFMDDEDVIRHAASMVLQRLGHETTTVNDGAEAIRAYQTALAEGRRYDVVILDLTVPGGMGGRLALEGLRQVDPEVRAIVSSGYSSDPVLANYRAYGFCAVVPKPYEIQDLARAIQAVRKSAPSAAPAPAMPG